MTDKIRANVFGEGRAEHDKSMLDHSFYEWQDFRTWLDTDRHSRTRR